jgi:GTP-binding protein HflX
VELDKDYSFVLSDTVGFINKLPHSLVESFQATLAEVKESDFLLHVVDASSEDAELQIETVHRVLEELGVRRKPVVLVLNKEDLVRDELSLNELLNRHGPGVVVSARTGRGLDELREAIRLQVASRNVVVDLDISAADSAVVARVHREGEVLEKEFVEDRVRMRARLPRPWAEKLRALGLVPSSEE